MAVAVYTAMFGGYDQPPPQVAQDHDDDVNWYAFTDAPHMFGEPWKVMRAQTSPGVCARMAAKRYKCIPHDQLAEPASIWIDANTEIISPTFVAGALKAMHDGIALFAHPQRRCVYQEATASLRLAPEKYGDERIIEQVAHYRSIGYPSRNGLFACGTIARQHDAPKIAELGRLWFAECVRWTYQDQLSLPVVCDQLGLEAGTFPHRQIGARDHFGNAWQTIHPHLSNK